MIFDRMDERPGAAILGGDPQTRMRFAHIIEEVQSCLGLEFLTSLATGGGVTVLCMLARVDFPIILGVLAFAFHFVPTIGSILASIPAVLLALILHGEVTALVVALGYLGISTVIGSILDPHIMGHRLGLSTLVALLSVPLTMVTKIALQNVPDLRWIAVLLDKVPPQAKEAARSAAWLMPTGAAVVSVSPGAERTGAAG